MDISPQRFGLECGEGTIAGWRWSCSGAPALVFAHATGFCAAAYKPMLALLAGRFDIWAIDLRGHGRTMLPADPGKLKDWSVYADDLSAFIERLDRRDGIFLAGHSCGAVVSALAAARLDTVSALALIEPVATQPLTALLARTPIWPIISRRTRMVRNALQRRAEWPGLSVVRASYLRKRLFKAWSPAALDGYLEDGFEPLAQGVALACSPEWEAATYAAQGHDFWGAMRRTGPISRILAAEPGSSTLFGAAERRFAQFGAEVTRLPGASHMLPMENPAAAAEFIAGAEARAA